MNYSNDHELFVFMREQLSSSLLSDALDEMGLRAQTMRENIRPCWRGAVVAGRAHTAAYAGVYDVTTKRDPANALTLMDSLQPDEVAVLTANGSSNGTLWAEMMSIAAQKLEVAGVVVDGLLRDVKEIEELQFPVFGRGARPLTVKGRMRLVAHNVPVDCGGVLVRPGDVVFGDLDGIVVVPKENLDDVVSLAVSLRDKENDTREKLLSGISMGKL